MLISNIRLNRATSADSIFLWELRNQPECRLNSFSLDEVSWENHTRWFESKLLSPNCLFFIIEFREFPVGQIRVDVDDNLSGEVHVSIAEEFRSLGIAKTAINLAFNDLTLRGLIVKMEANIKIQNLQSVIMFLRVGFKFKSYMKRDNLEIYTLSKSDL